MTSHSQHARHRAAALIEALRPKQFTKNLFVFAAPLFAGQYLRPMPMFRALEAFVVFCITAGAIYLLNDILDRAPDAQHPRKRSRPIASGRLGVIAAAWASGILLACGLGFAATVSLHLLMATAAYAFLQILYCIWMKHVPVLDVFVLAAGFVLRAVAGGAAASLPISPWLLLCTFVLALFLGFGKRRQELVSLGEDAASHRRNLEEYSLPFLDHAITMTSTLSVIAYAVYSIESVTAQRHPGLWISSLLVLFGVSRYLWLVYHKGQGGAPDELLLTDRVLQLDTLAWLITVGLVLRGA